jgi:hypothetical protein
MIKGRNEPREVVTKGLNNIAPLRSYDRKSCLASQNLIIQAPQTVMLADMRYCEISKEMSSHFFWGLLYSA